jgi:hypothetical protein
VYNSLAFLFFLVPNASSLILSFMYPPPPCSRWVCWLPVLHSSDYLRLSGLDPVTNAIWIVSFNLIVSYILRRTMVHADPKTQTLFG